MVRYTLLALLAYEGWSLLDGVAQNTLSEVYVRTALRYPMLPYCMGLAVGGWLVYIVMQSTLGGVPITPNDVAAIVCVCTLGGHLNWQFASPEPQPPLDRTP